MSKPAPDEPRIPTLQEHAKLRPQADRPPVPRDLSGLVTFLLVTGGIAAATFITVTVYGQKIARLFKPATSSGGDMGRPTHCDDVPVPKVSTDFNLSNMGEQDGSR